MPSATFRAIYVDKVLALADMLKSAGWRDAALQPDDLDMGRVGKCDQSRFVQACRACGLDPSALTSYRALRRLDMPNSAKPRPASASVVGAANNVGATGA